MDVLIIYKFQLYRCFGFSFIQIQDYGHQNLALLAKILPRFFFAGLMTTIGAGGVTRCCGLGLQVRLPLLKPSFLLNISTHEVAKRSQKVLLLVMDAIGYHLLPERKNSLPPHWLRPRVSNGKIEVTILQWVLVVVMMVMWWW